jgi:hypothetical protein
MDRCCHRRATTTQCHLLPIAEKLGVVRSQGCARAAGRKVDPVPSDEGALVLVASRQDGSPDSIAGTQRCSEWPCSALHEFDDARIHRGVLWCTIVSPRSTCVVGQSRSCPIRCIAADAKHAAKAEFVRTATDRRFRQAYSTRCAIRNRWFGSTARTFRRTPLGRY